MTENQVETMNETKPQDSNPKMNPMLIIGLFAVIAVFGVGLLLIKGSSSSNPQTSQSITQQESQVANTTNTNQVAAQDDTGATAITVEGGMYYFKPNEIRVKKGEKVKIVFTNAGGMHDLVIDEFNVKTERVQSGQTTSVVFTPDKTGTFEFYCSVGNHRAMGMKGKLIVE